MGKRTMVGGLEAPSALPSVPAPLPPPPVEWTVAVTDESHETMSTAQVVVAYASGTIDEETFIWREGMSDWETPFDIAEIAQALRARGIKPTSAELPSPARALSGQSQPAEVADTAAAIAGAALQATAGDPTSGVWREPGRWNEPGSPFGEPMGSSPFDDAFGDEDVGFDDVTVAMKAPQAEELLRQAATEAEERAAAERERGLLPSEPPGPSPDDATVRFDKSQAPELGALSSISEALAAARAPPTAERAAPTAERAAPTAERAALTAERAAPTAERAAPTAERAALTAGRVAPTAERAAPTAERMAPTAERVAGAPERVAPIAERISIPKPRAATRRAAEQKPVDLFGKISEAGSQSDASFTEPDEATRVRDDHPRMMGARNETSVLFSLDKMMQTTDEPKAERKREVDEALFAPRPSAGTPLPSTAFVAPDFSAPVVEPPKGKEKEKAQQPVVAVPAAAATAAVPEEKGGRALLWALLVVLLLAGAAALGFALKQPPALFGPGAPFGTRAAETPATADTVPEAPPTATAAATAAEDAGVAPADATTAVSPDAVPLPVTRPVPAPAAPRPAAGKPAPKEPPAAAEEKAVAPGASDLPAFDRAGASTALGGAAGSVSSCKQPDGPSGTGRVTVTFAPSGRVTSAIVTGDLAGTAIGGCVARIFRQAKVAPFSGEPVTVAKSFSIQ
jgi:hypothetical protein